MFITHGACSSVALAGFALPECPGSSSRVYPALEGLTVVVNSCGLQDVQRAMRTSCGARKLVRTPHVNQKKKKIKSQTSPWYLNCSII